MRFMNEILLGAVEMLEDQATQERTWPGVIPRDSSVGQDAPRTAITTVVADADLNAPAD
jgi:hypothetical protein